MAKTIHFLYLKIDPKIGQLMQAMVNSLLGSARGPMQTSEHAEKQSQISKNKISEKEHKKTQIYRGSAIAYILGAEGKRDLIQTTNSRLQSMGTISLNI